MMFWFENAAGLPCASTVGAIYLFVMNGLEPGSFARALFLRDRERAGELAHATLSSNDVDRLFDFVGKLPQGMFDTPDRFKVWPGLNNSDDKIKLAFKLYGI